MPELLLLVEEEPLLRVLLPEELRTLEELFSLRSVLGLVVVVLRREELLLLLRELLLLPRELLLPLVVAFVFVLSRRVVPVVPDRLVLELLRRVVYTSSLAGARLEPGRTVTEPKSERRCVV